MGVRLATSLLLAFLALAVSAPASAARPCWRDVLNDRYDGALDRTYAPRCYSEALDHVPADLEAYTATSDDIRRALLAALDTSRATPASEPVRAPADAPRQTDTGGVAGVQATLAGPKTTPPKPLDGASIASRSPVFYVLPLLALALAAAAKLLARGAYGRRCTIRTPCSAASRSATSER